MLIICVKVGYLLQFSSQYQRTHLFYISTRLSLPSATRLHLKHLILNTLRVCEVLSW